MLVAGSLPAPLPEPEPALALVTGIAGAGVVAPGRAASAVPAPLGGTDVAARATVSAVKASRPNRRRGPRGLDTAEAATCSFVSESVVTLRVSEHPWRLLTHAERNRDSVPVFPGRAGRG